MYIFTWNIVLSNGNGFSLSSCSFLFCRLLKNWAFAYFFVGAFFGELWSAYFLYDLQLFRPVSSNEAALTYMRNCFFFCVLFEFFFLHSEMSEMPFFLHETTTAKTDLARRISNRFSLKNEIEISCCFSSVIFDRREPVAEYVVNILYSMELAIHRCILLLFARTDFSRMQKHR